MVSSDDDALEQRRLSATFVDALEPPMSTELLRSVQEQGFRTLLPIQLKVWKALGGGKQRLFDLRICSPTGSGKTLAFVLPILQAIQGKRKNGVKCIAILPTKDLAQQVFDTFSECAKYCNINLGIAAALTSIDHEREQFGTRNNAMVYDGVDILVATPGRLRTHLESRVLDLQFLDFIVFDEMDRLLQQSYNDCIPYLLKRYSDFQKQKYDHHCNGMGNNFMTPQYKCLEDKLTKISLSATVSSDTSKTVKLQEEFVKTISAFDSNVKYTLPPKLHQYKIVCARERKPFVFLDIISKIEKQRVICFTNSTEASSLLVNLVAKSKIGWSCAPYNSRVSLKERKKILQRYREGEINIIMASDALSRGLDIPKISLVINYDNPTSTKNYIHRVGRTARVGSSGNAISILQKEDVIHFKRLVNKIEGTEYSKIKQINLDGMLNIGIGI